MEVDIPIVTCAPTYICATARQDVHVIFKQENAYKLRDKAKDGTVLFVERLVQFRIGVGLIGKSNSRGLQLCFRYLWQASDSERESDHDTHARNSHVHVLA